MARPSNRSLGAPGFGPDQRGATQRLGVYAPLNVNTGPSGAERLATQLGVLTQAATPFVQDKIERRGYEQALAGTQAARDGVSEEVASEEDKAFQLGYRTSKADEASLMAQAEWDKHYAEEVDKSISPEKLRDEYNSFMQQRLSQFIADPSTAQRVYDHLAPNEAALVQQQQKVLANQFVEDTIATQAAFVRDRVIRGRAVNPEEVMRVLRPTLGNSGASKAYVGIIGSMAVERGDPDLLDTLIPEKWETGVPGPRSVPELNDEINTYRYYATRAQEADARNAEKLAEAEWDQEKIAITNIGFHGDVMEAEKRLNVLAARGGIDPPEYRTMLGALRGDEKQLNLENTDLSGFAQLRLDIYSGKVSSSQLIGRGNDVLPRGPEGLGAWQALMDDYQSYERSKSARVNDPQFKYHFDVLRTRFGTDEIGADLVSKERWAAVQKVFYDEYTAGGDAEKAYARATKFGIDTRSEATTSITNTTLPTEVSEALAAPYTVGDDVKAAIAGRVPRETFVRRYGGPDGPSEINAARERGELDSDQAIKALQLLPR
jgi:hypothetical protein